MPRLMLSAGMFSALAAAMAERRRGLPSGSPPPERAAMVISLMMRVKILPRLASRAPFLCLIVAHLEWPDINEPLALKELTGPSSQTHRTRPDPTFYDIRCAEIAEAPRGPVPQNGSVPMGRTLRRAFCFIS